MKEERLKDLVLDFTDVDEFTRNRVVIESRKSNFLKNFFGYKIFSKLKIYSHDIVPEKEPSSREDNSPIKVCTSTGEIFTLDHLFDFGSFPDLDEELILELVETKEFLTFWMDNWYRISKKTLLKLIIKFKNTLGKMVNEKITNSFAYSLFKIDFKNIEKTHIPYVDLISENFNLGKQEKLKFLQFEDFEEFFCEIKRLAIRRQFMKKYLIGKFYDDILGTEIGARTFQKFLKDEIMIEILRDCEEYVIPFDLSNIAGGFFNKKDTEIKLKNLSRDFNRDHLFLKIFPSKTILIDFIIKFLDKNFHQYRDSLQVCKLISVLVDYSDAWLVSIKK